MITALDVGQARDPAAVVQLDREHHGRPWVVASAEEFPRGTEYTVLADYAALATGAGPVLVDRTGVGRPVVERAREYAAHRDAVVGVTATGGQAVRWHGKDVSVPKTSLVRAAQAAVEHNRVLIPNNSEGHSLARQLRRLRRDQRGRMEAHHGHDDLAFAMCMAAWATEQQHEWKDTHDRAIDRDRRGGPCRR